jgi:ATP-dependent helicase/nuclease subunit B
MRKEAGLLLPERQIGLSAHDYQQAVAAPRVVLSRSLRGAEAEACPRAG